MEIIESISKLLDIDMESFNIATGLIIEFEDYYLFSIQNEQKWITEGGICNIGLVGIGGGREGDESIEDCLLRECKEEINEKINLVNEQHTILITEDMSFSIIDIGINFLERNPFAISIVKNTNGKYRGKQYTIVFSYRTILDHIPAIGDVYGFILCKKENIHKINQMGMMYEEWKNLGCCFVTKESLKKNSRLIPFGTFRSFIALKNGKLE